MMHLFASLEAVRLQGSFLWLELSSQAQQLIEKDFKGRSPAETFAGTKIEFVGEGGEESRIEGLQVSRLGAILADKPIRVFVSTAHPGRMRRREEERNIAESSGNFSMLCKLHAAIRSTPSLSQ